ncbi:phage portal protein [Methylocystis iwaonis]|uniref:phage portal protein n=1 Tax=Methylocystis iwaonis TaxID=2885079 RepID=UPI002E7B9EFB|nr:phage portal protein [Methylocystis iwaonis]
MTFRPNLFDRALLSVAPRAGLARIQARMAAEQMLRAYDGASRDRRLSGWRASAAGPRAEGDSGRDLLRYRARDLDQNNKTVRAAKLQFQGQTVGSGITPRAVGANKTMRKKANDAWARFVDTCDADGMQDYYGLLSLTAGSMFVDGEVLHLWSNDRAAPWGKIRVLEVDHFDDTQAILSRGTSDRIVNGIEFDDWGTRVAYWLFPSHPGENNVLKLASVSKRVLAEDVDHYFHVARPGQIRGVSWLAPSIVALRGLDDVTEAIIWRKRIEACIGLVIRSPETQGAAPVVGAQKTDSAGRREETLSPGKILRMGPGEDAVAFTPSASGDTLEFIRSQLYAFCATTGVAYHEITGDASQANYSSMRAAKIAGYVLMDMVQWLVLAPRIKTAWRRVMYREFVLTGDARFKDMRCELSMPVRPWVDPLKDIMAKVLEIRAGLAAQPDALAERGINWEDFIAEVRSWLAATDADGLIFDTDPRKVNDAGALQAAVTAQGASAGGGQAQSQS